MRSRCETNVGHFLDDAFVAFTKIGAVFVLVLLLTAAFSFVASYKRSVEDISKDAIDSVVAITCTDPVTNTTHFSAGFIISDTGHILTVAHGVQMCVNNSSYKLQVRFKNDPSKPYEATVVKSQPGVDLAVLFLYAHPQGLKPLILSEEAPLIGSLVVAIGHPMALTWSTTSGIISAERTSTRPYYKCFQVTSPIHHGNSGGPLLNERGEIVGVIRSVRANAAGLPESSYGFVTASELVKAFLYGIRL